MKLPISVAVSINKCDSGGQKSLALGYLRNLDPKKVKFQLIVDSDSNSIPYEEIEKLGGKIHVVPPYQKIGAHMKAVEQVFRQEQFDVLFAMNNTMNVFPLYLAKKCDIKVRISESLSMAAKAEWKKSLMKQVLKHFSHWFCNYYVACGHDCGRFQFGKKAIEEGKVEIFKTCIDAKANTFDKELRDKTRKKFGWEEKTVYGFIGRFSPQKNPIFLIDILNEIKKRKENAHFVIIGAGSLENQMLQRIDGYGLKDSVSWLGRREDIKQFYNAFDAFLLPSRYEGLPVVGLESQAAGLPVFFSDAITQEASVCELGHFISLKQSAGEWAKTIIRETDKNIPIRKGHEDDLIRGGYDAVAEAERLTEYWLKAVEEQENR
ncbi:MAG: glycosyltransferase [Bacteroidaceae bacterium]|nr:glycosyltransferase [Bacteroidaceae bacterium]